MNKVHTKVLKKVPPGILSEPRAYALSRFRFYVALITAFLLGLLGFILASLFPLPAPYTLSQTKLIYASFGVLISMLIFAQLTTWLIRTFTSLSRQLILRLSSEIINQLTHLTSSSLPFFSGTDKKTAEIKLSKPLIVDTSAIIDGRIKDLAKTGFLSEFIIIPDFVLTELQQVADSADSIKRSRGRRGFEIIEEIKKLETVTIKIWDKAIKGKAVDDKLIRLSKALNGKLLTCDYNLSRVAEVSGIRVLNLNELANSLKALPIPGEKLSIKIISSGKDKSQGVGYLSDGTMVVVKDGASEISHNIPVEVTKIIQGPAGRMIFGKVA